MSLKDAKVKVNTSSSEVLDTTGGYLKGVVLQLLTKWFFQILTISLLMIIIPTI